MKKPARLHVVGSSGSEPPCIPIAGSEATEPDDPIFALIDAHRKAEAQYYAYPGPAEDPEFDQLGDETEGFAWDLAKVQPTTLKGVQALARYASTDNADQQRWPDEPEWRATLLKNIANALEHIQYL